MHRTHGQVRRGVVTSVSICMSTWISH